MPNTIAKPLIKISPVTLGYLNRIFTDMTIEERLKYVYHVSDLADILVTSSFGTKSNVLLHHVSRINSDQVVHFVDTTYNFVETLAYRDLVSSTFGLEIKSIYPNKIQNKLTQEEGWWVEHPKMCCTINKIAPLEPIIANHKIWISSLMAFQTSFRQHLRIFEKQGQIIKFHPLIDISMKDFEIYQKTHNLPEHPLARQGYGSVGCTHCTRKGEGRDGRWSNTGQAECGLHPHYFTNK